MTFDPLNWIEDELDRLQHEQLLRRPSVRGSRQGPRIAIDGLNLINFGSNDYLSLAADPRLAAAATQSLTHMGWGSGASPLITGRTAAQAELERHLAAFEQSEAAIVFPSGFAANAGTLAALAGPSDIILSDAKNHASLIDGCRLSRAQVVIYPHLDLHGLQQQLQSTATARRRLIVTDSLFSMDGDLAPLADLVELAERHQAILVVDEAHATGVFGAHGRGVCEQMGIEDRVPVRIGTLSKALGSIGGFVVGQRRLIDWLYNRARSFVFSTALPTPCYSAAKAALEVVRQEPRRRLQLLEKAARLRDSLRELGWDTGSSASQIIPLRVGEAGVAMELAEQLRSLGILVPGIRPPTVPHGESLLRISLCYGHSGDHLGRLLETLKSASRRS